ncbi:type II secretion system protein [Micavibrio aeruginosavorus]|uniref:type II secretion system protein n=1 Tax=Micavibrio aeruginosavorus TaxID=349221 RepID=UPI003F4A8CB7
MRIKNFFHFLPSLDRPRTRERVSTHPESGFTLLEMVIVTLITSLIMGAIFNLMNQDGQIKSARMNGIFDTVLLGIAEYQRIYGFYPCPADPTLRPGNVNYGEPNIDAAGNCNASGGIVAASGYGGGTVMIGAVPVRALNLAMGCVDSTQRMNVDDMDDNLKQVFQNKLNSVQQIFFDQVGKYADYSDFDQDTSDGTANTMNMQNATETSRKCVTENFAKDIYTTKLTYAVTRDATRLNPTEPAGNIRVINRNGNDATSAPVHFVLVSHGPDMKGAYMDQSGAIGTACSGGALDVENCNNNATFRAMPFAGMGNGTDANHFDDRIEFSLNGYQREKDSWRWSSGTGTQRNVVLDADDDQSMVIGTPGAWVASTDAKLSVFAGSVAVDGNIKAEGATTLSEPAEVNATLSINAGKDIIVEDDVSKDGIATAPAYCYSPSLVAGCGN